MKSKIKKIITCIFIILSNTLVFSQDNTINDTTLQDFLKSGLTVVSSENFNSSIINIPYEIDFIYDKNIYFTYSLQNGKFRALYILKPKQYKMLALDNQIEATSTPFLIVGIQLNKPGYKIVKMPFVTFVEP